jgi:cytidylate kinase
MKRLIIAVDGPVGSGKSTVARRVAELLGYTYLDSGAMYRAVALKALFEGARRDLDEEKVKELLSQPMFRQGIACKISEPGKSFEDASWLEGLAARTRIDFEHQPGGVTRVRLDGKDVTEMIRATVVSLAASRVAQVPGVRRILVAEQQRAGAKGNVVMEGRDIGTVVFPHADLKIFLEASVEVRGERRWREHQQKGDASTLEQTIEEVRERDRRDRTREVSPLVQAADAVLVDNTAMGIEETARLIVLLARERESEGAKGAK